MIIKIITLTVENFKGCEKLHLDLNGKNADIYGDNATGKTTIYDAVTWLLFDKDSNGDARFSVKPMTAEGEPVHNVMPTVTAMLDCNGERVTLRKQLREKWEKHRGGAERYAGNTVDYYIDDVPTKEGDYKGYVSTLCPEDVFKMLTGAHRFCGEIPWKQRRAVLFDLAGVQSETELLQQPQFALLAAEIGGRTVEEFEAALVKKRKDTNAMLNQIPARLDELERQLAGLPTAFDPAAREAIERDMQAASAKLAGLDSNETLREAENKLAKTEQALAQLDLKNREYRMEQELAQATNDRASLKETLEGIADSIMDDQQAAQRMRHRIARENAGLDHLRSEWMEVNGQTYTGSDTCPTCGQVLPPERIAEARARFETAKQDKLDAITRRAAEYGQTKTEYEAELDTVKQHLAELMERQAEYQRRLDETPEPTPVQDMPDYPTKREALEAMRQSEAAELAVIMGDLHGLRTKIRQEIAELGKAKLAQDTLEAQCRSREATLRRIHELTEERAKRNQYMDHLDELIDLCAEFTTYKTEFVSDTINRRFGLVKFRLFHTAINGSITECCEPEIDGVPYRDVNSAMQINAGLDCIQTLSQFYDVRVPLFVDNAESITELRDIDTQIIRLIVSENDKKLRCETK